jgi:HK97 family phage major capsid protein
MEAGELLAMRRRRRKRKVGEPANIKPARRGPRATDNHQPTAKAERESEQMRYIPGLKTSRQWADEASAYLDRHVKNDSFNLQAKDTFDRMMQLAKMGNEHRYFEMFPKSTAEETLRRRWVGYDSATRAFFSRETPNEPMTSESGTIFAMQSSTLGMLKLGTQRSYAGLSTSTGGDTVPIGFLDEVISRAKAYDGLLDAARWVYTDNGSPLSIPTGDDTAQDAAILNEGAPINQGPNPIFSTVAFGSCPLWSTNQLLTSIALTQDSPVLADFLAEAFGRRIARGAGKAFLTTLLSAADVGGTTSSPTAVVIDELIDLQGAIDAEYWARSSWLMNLKSWLTIRKLQTVNHYYVAENAAATDSGRPVFLGRPVYICPNLADIGASAKPIVLGDLNRFLVRAVNQGQEVFRYDQLFMASNSSYGWQSFWRLDGAFVKAGSNSDKPIVALQCHS